MDPTRVRPIAMGDVSLKVVGKCLLQAYMPSIDQTMGDIQYGVGRPNGRDSIIHSVQLASQLDETVDILQLDFRNAFNNVSCFQILTQVINLFPNLEDASQHRTKIFAQTLCFIDIMGMVVAS